MNILIIVLAFNFLILIHELGHFTLARINGVRIEEFSLGMGPQIFKIIKNKTMFSIRLFPIGGFVKMFGENTDNKEPDSFTSKSPLRKLSIVVAGAVMNILLAITLVSIISFKYGYPSLTIDTLMPNLPAYTAGLKSGDVITKVDSSRVFTWADFKTYLAAPNDSVNLSYIRNNKEYTVNIPYNKKASVNSIKLGINPKEIDNPSIRQSINHSLAENISLSKQVFLFFKTLFQGKASANSFGGPVSIVKISSSVIQTGYSSFIYFIALISLQLGILNLMPFPALDGFYVFVYLYELLTRKKANNNKIGVINTVGFSVLMILMVLVTIKDIIFPINF